MAIAEAAMSTNRADWTKLLSHYKAARALVDFDGSENKQQGKQEQRLPQGLARRKRERAKP